jgi:hypothetical protein
MPSSPSPQSSGQTPTVPLKQKEAHEYRQTTYHRGSSVQIAESRRHPWAVRKVEQPVQECSDFVLYPEENDHLYAQSGFEEVSSQSHPALRRRAAQPSSAHVTSAKQSIKLGPKPVILHTGRKASQELPLETKVVLHNAADPTPPATPRLARLPTPDFDDLDEAPFCDCGVESHVVERCTECGKEVDRW